MSNEKKLLYINLKTLSPTNFKNVKCLNQFIVGKY